MNSTEEDMYSMEYIDDSKFPEFKIAITIREVLILCIILAGGFGNVATVFVMRRIKEGNSSQQVVLIALAVVDFLLLHIGALREWIIDIFDVDVRDLHTVVCKLHVWAVYSLGTMSAWLVTCVTIQRTIAVRLPHRTRTMFTVRRTRMAVAAVVLTSSALHFHMVVGMETDHEYGCDSWSVWYSELLWPIWTWVDMCMSSVLPSLCLLVCDAILSMTLFEVTSTKSITVHTITHADSLHNNERRKAAFKTTVMILVLSITFLVLTLPVCVYFIWFNTLVYEIDTDDSLFAKSQLAHAVTSLLWYTNSAVNFLLYCITGTRFRREFFRWICCCRRVD